MTGDWIKNWAVPAAGALIALAGTLLRFVNKRKLHTAPDNKKVSRRAKLGLILSVGGIWLFVVKLLPLVLGPAQHKAFTVEISPPRSDLVIAGFQVSTTVITTWVVMAVLVFAAVLLRVFVIPRMRTVPKGIQNVLELFVDGVNSYTDSQTGGLGDGLSAYIFSIAAFMVASAFVELFGARAPTTDITMTFALAFSTFILINFYGIRQKGVAGRLKALANPTPAVFALRVISDMALPVSMACRLFGNMLGGMIVMELLYSALGNSAVAIPSVVGLYFNIFHPLIQAFIFVTLTLTFIKEATE